MGDSDFLGRAFLESAAAHGPDTELPAPRAGSLRGDNQDHVTISRQDGYRKPQGGMPTSVKVGYKTYRIESWSHREAVGSSRYGETCHPSNRISIDMCFGAVNAAKTLLHEIMHACCWVFSRPDEADEEATVTVLSNALATVWIDNPNVMAWIAISLTSGDN